MTTKPRREPDPPGLVCLAAISGAFGVRGDVRLKLFTDDGEALTAYGPLLDRQGRAFTVLSIRAQKDGASARLKGVTDRNAAEALKGTALYVAREALPDLDEEDAFYQADLVGLLAVLTDGAPLGTVTAVQDFGAGDLLDIRVAASGKSVLVPFTRAIVPVVDLSAGRVTIDPPEGLLDQDRPPKKDEDTEDTEDVEDGPS